jgi:hypothetical protein
MFYLLSKKKMSNLMNGVKNKNWWLKFHSIDLIRKPKKFSLSFYCLWHSSRGKLKIHFKRNCYISRYVTGRLSNLKNMSRIRKKTFYLQFCMGLLQVCLVIQKWKEGKNSCGLYPTEFAGLTQNPKKNIRTPNLSIRTNIFPKKLCLVP